MTAKETLKQWFSNLKKPTQAHFWAWLDSFWHKSEKIPMENIDGLDSALQDTASNTQFQAHLTDNQAHKELFDIVKVQIDQIKTILNSDDTELDQLQEIVNYIKQNKQVLSALAISNIAGLVEALAGKANATHHHDTLYYNKEQVDNLLDRKQDKKVAFYTQTDSRLFLRGDVDSNKTILWGGADTLNIQANGTYNAPILADPKPEHNYVVSFIKTGTGDISIDTFFGGGFTSITPQGTYINGQLGSSGVMFVDFVNKLIVLKIDNL